MTFQSLEYLLFFPLVFLFYWGVGQRHRNLQNGILLVSSFIFYGWWDWRFLSLLLLTIFSTFLSGVLMESFSKQSKRRKLVFVGMVLLNLGILFVFKYYNFFIKSLNDAFASVGLDISLSTMRILLPVGISFYTFSALSYLIDVYQRKINPTYDWIAYSAYISFFPSILSGPISRAQKQLPQYFTLRTFNYNQIITGCKYILWGG